MNTPRVIVIGLVGLLIGVLVGFGFRGSLAQLLNLEAYVLPGAIQTSTNSNIPGVGAEGDLSGIVGIGWKETDLYSKAKSISIPTTIILDTDTIGSWIGQQGFPGLRYPTKINFDLGTITAAEKAAVDTCMTTGISTATVTYSSCLVENVIKPRATKK
jgi:hypothetical protein